MDQEEQRQRYINAHGFLKRLRQARIRLTPQEVDTLRRQAIAGDVEGAERGLQKLIERGGTRYDDTLRWQTIPRDIEGAERGLQKLIERGGIRYDDF